MARSFAIVGFSTGAVRRIESDTLAVSSLPDAPKSVSCVKALAADDIWVGHFSLALNDRAEMSHYNGTSWTLHEVAGSIANPFDTGVGWQINDFVFTDLGELFAIGACFNRSPQLFQWNGASWGVVATFPNGARDEPIDNKATATDMWCASFLTSVQHEMANWNGSTTVESSPVKSPTLLVGRSISGVARNNAGDVFVAVDDGNDALIRTAPNTWSVAFSTTTAQKGSPGNVIDHQPLNDTLWWLVTESTGGVVSWDGSTKTFYDVPQFTAGRVASHISVIAKSPAPSGVQVWMVTNVADELIVGDPDAADWTLIDLSVSAGHSYVDAFQGSTDTAPRVTDESPAPGATQLPPDVTLSASIVDDDGDLNAESVRIYVNDTLAWYGSRLVGGFTGERNAVSSPDGFNYGFTPIGDFEPGVQTIRVVASSVTETLDTSWTIETTVAQTPSIETPVDVPTAGLDLDLGDQSSWDLVIEGGDLALVAGVDEVVQHLRVGLLLFKADWYRDRDAGVPYYTYILTNAPNSRLIEGIFRADILGDVDVEALESFEMQIDRRARTLSVEFRAKSSVGPVNMVSVFP